MYRSRTKYRIPKLMISIILLLLASFFVYGQKIIPNVNPNAKELYYHLTPKKDTLVICSDYKIHNISIVSDDFSLRVDVNTNTKRIPIKHLLKGRYTVITITNRKIITFNLVM